MPDTTSSPATDAERGLLALPEEERRRRGEILRAMDEFFRSGDAEEQATTFEALVKAIEEDRSSGRPTFAL